MRRLFVLAISVFLSLLSPAPASGGERRSISDLKPGHGIGRALKPIGAHRYRVALGKGEAARVLINQRGIDVSVSMTTPDSPTLTIDAFERGYESVTLLAETSGIFMLEIRQAPSASLAGSYEIWLTLVRPKTPEDAVRAQAERDTTEGRAFLARHTRDTVESARAKLLRARDLWRKLGETSAELRTLILIGDSEHAMSQYDAARERYREVVSLSRATGDRRSEAEAQNNIGMMDWQQGRTQESFAELRQAMDLWESLEKEYGGGATLSNLGLLSWQTGEWRDALAYYAKALDVLRAVGHRAGQAFTLNNIGLAYATMGNLDASLEYLDQAVRLFLESNDRLAAGKATGTIAKVRLLRGDLALARERLQRAKALLTDSPDVRSIAETLNIQGEIEIASGAPGGALASCGRALEMFRSIDDRRGAANSLQHLAAARMVLGENDLAFDLLQQALALRRAMNDGDAAAGIHFLMAQTRLRQGLLEDARPLLDAAVAAAESLRTRVAGQQLRASYLAAKIEYFQTYVDTLMQLSRRNHDESLSRTALEVAERARARSLLDLLEESHSDIGSDVSPELQARERAARQELNYRSYLLARLLAAKHPAAAEPSARAGLEKAAAGVEALEAQVRASNPRYAALALPVPLTASAIQRDVLDSGSVLLEFSLGSPRSYVWAVTPTSVHGYELASQEDLESKARRAAQCFQSGAGAASGAAECATALSGVSDGVLRPLVAELGENRLVIVSDGALAYVPFAALPDPSGAAPLIVRHEIVSLPSASAMATLRRELRGRRPAPLDIAVVADPVFDRDDPRVKAAVVLSGSSRPLGRALRGDASEQEALLPNGLTRLPRLLYSREEARRILALVPPGRGFGALDFDASMQTVFSAGLDRYRIIHFATHGFLNSAHPDLSGLVFSLVDRNGHAQNGFLRLNDLYGLRLASDLVVLSACKTGLGREIRGEGLVGLTRGFLYAGAARVIVSLWNVDDEATADLMQRFYAAVLGPRGLRPAAALREAQISLWKDSRWNSPYYWAGFRLEGEWQ